MNKESIRYIADYYGFDEQKHQLEEEMAELTIALNKYRRNINKVSKSDCDSLIFNIAEEIADVRVMLEQMMLFVGVSESFITGEMKKKIKRQLERIEEEKTEKEKEEV